jgi:hypothetical protein
MLKKPKVFKHATYNPLMPRVTTIKSKIPQWYKDMPVFKDGEKTAKFLPLSNLTIKHCVPFLDGLTTGYCIPLPVDVLVTQRFDGPELSWGNNAEPPVSTRVQSAAPNLPIYEGFSTTHHFIWRMPHVLKLPKGYSVIYTHPLNRYDLPFLTLSAVVDADWAVGGGNVPFFISKTFEGVIPQGTPIMQIIPFKREEWVSEEDPSIVDENKQHQFDSQTTLSGWYKKTFWNKKTYN